MIISFPKIIFEIEHYECKSRMMNANDGGFIRMSPISLQTSFIFGEGRGSDIKLHGFPFLSHM